MTEFVSKILAVTGEFACSWYNLLTKQKVCCYGCEDQGNRQLENLVKTLILVSYLLETASGFGRIKET